MNEFKKLQSEKLLQHRKKKCVMCAGVLAQPKTRVKSFYEAMLDINISAPVISEVLNSWGVSASVTSVHNHRRGVKGYAAHLDEIKKAAGL